jgi:adenylate cyclase
MGINSGEVVVGKIGDDLRMDYTAQGHTVGLAARVEELASPDTCYLTGQTAALVRGYFELEDLGSFNMKGVREPVSIFQLQGMGALRTRLDVSRARGFSKFVGRTDEVAALEAALERALQGNGRVVGVVGEAGVGKSRLCFEFLERCRAQGLTTYEAHGVAHGKAIPFLPILGLFRSYLGITEQDRPEAAREKIAGRLLLLDDSFREALPLVFGFLGVSDPERPAPRMDPEARQRQLYGLVKRVLKARGLRETTVTLLEDLHWFDGGSEAFLDAIVEVLPATRGLLLVNFRPEYHARWMQKSYYEQMPIVPLSPEAIQELVSDLLGHDPSVERLPETIHERTGGNPFFIEELVRSLLESGHLMGHRGAHRLVTPVEEIRVPATVEAVVAARIDRLTEREKQLLQTASVIGKTFTDPLLREVVELPDVELASALATLKDGEFLYEVSLYPEVEYAFKHPLTQDVALNSQLQDRRGRIHAAVARAIEASRPDRLDEEAAGIARHWEEAGDPLEAARWNARAAAWVGTSDVGESVRHWQRVCELLRPLPETDDAGPLHILSCTQILNSGWRLGLSQEEADAFFTEGKGLAERRGDTRALSFLTGMYSARIGTSGNPSESVGHGLEATRLADASGDLEARCLSRCGLAYAYFSSGQLREALAITDRALELVGEDPTIGTTTVGFSAVVWLRFERGCIENWVGRLDEAGRDLERAMELARELDEAEVLGWALAVSAFRARFSGALGSERAWALQSVEIAEKLGSPYSLYFALHCLGLAHLLHEEWEEGIHSSERALEVGRTRRTGLEAESGVLANLARGYLSTGEAEQARRTAEEAVRAARRGGARAFEIEAQLSLAHVLVAMGGTKARAGVEEALTRAVELVHETGAKSLEPPILVERAGLMRLLGNEAGRERELREAHRLYTEMGATGHAERVARELTDAPG